MKFDEIDAYCINGKSSDIDKSAKENVWVNERHVYQRLFRLRIEHLY